MDSKRVDKLSINSLLSFNRLVKNIFIEQIYRITGMLKEKRKKKPNIRFKNLNIL